MARPSLDWAGSCLRWGLKHRRPCSAKRLSAGTKEEDGRRLKVREGGREEGAAGSLLGSGIRSRGSGSLAADYRAAKLEEEIGLEPLIDI